jgi:hypothetical protein
MEHIQPIDILETFIRYWKYVPDRYEELREGISKLDSKQQDILHAIENSNFHVVDGYKLAKEIKELRLLRRQYKNEFELMEQLRQFVNNNKNFEINIFKVKTTMDKMNHRQQNAIYTPRIKEGVAIE